MTRAEGASAFGADPVAYDKGRLDYPSRVYDILRDTCGTGPGTTAFEIGPGTGKASRPLLALGIASLTGIEADPRLAAFLETTLGPTAGSRLRIITATFQDVDLPEGAFGLGVAASAFHWLDEAPALTKIARALRPGGWWAMCWNVLGDPSQPDPFRDATQALFTGWADTPTDPKGDRPHFALDIEARIGALRAAGFEQPACATIRWTTSFDTAAIQALYATFSPLTRLRPAERRHFLASIGRIAEHEFGGVVTRTYLTPVYTARRP